MKKRRVAPQAIFISPDASGWRLSSLPGAAGRAGAKHVESLAAAAPLVGESEVLLALPASDVLMERLTLPSKEPEELEGMVRLQLEKTLPYPTEEISCDYAVLREEETDSVVVATAVHNPALDMLCKPLRDRGCLPRRVSVFAAHIAALHPKGAVMAVYREQERVLVALCEDGHPVFLHALESTEAEAVEFELLQVLLAAEMEGAPSEFAEVRVDPSCAELKPVLAQMFDVPVSDLAVDAVPWRAGSDLVPSAWEEEATGLRRAVRLRRRLIVAGALYLALVLAAIAFVIVQKQRVRALDRKLAEARPRLDALQAQQGRWNAVAPAVAPSRFTIELLHQVLEALPPGVTLTQFDQTVSQFLVEGEAPSAAAAIQFAENLRANEALSEFLIESGPPTILPGDRAQFRIFGKL